MHTYAALAQFTVVCAGREVVSMVRWGSCNWRLSSCLSSSCHHNCVHHRLCQLTPGNLLSANMNSWPNVGLMLAQRRRRWSSIELIFDQRLLFPGACTRPRWARRALAIFNIPLLITNSTLYKKLSRRDIIHFVLCCPAYTVLRLKYIKKNIINNILVCINLKNC